MKKDRITLLRDRYIKAKNEYKDPYFDADEIDDLLNSFEESGDLLMYEELLELGLRLHPGSTTLQIRLCREYLMDEDTDKVLDLISRIGEKGNQDLDLIEIECYVILEDYSKVIELTEKLIEQKAEYLAFVFEYITPLLNDMEQYKEAVDYAERGLRLFPHNFTIKEELCYALENTDNFERAIKLCNDLIDLKPYSFDLWFALGRLYAFSGDFPKAIDAFDFALTCNESATELKLLLIFCLLKNENFERASLLCEEILPETDNKEAIVNLLAECLMSMNRHEEAYLYLKQYMISSNELLSPGMYIIYARSCIETERNEEAFEVMRQVNALYPDEPGIRFISSRIPSLSKGGTADDFIDELSNIFRENIEDLHRFAESEGIYSSLTETEQEKYNTKTIASSLAKKYITDKGNRN